MDLGPNLYGRWEGIMSVSPFDCRMILGSNVCVLVLQYRAWVSGCGDSPEMRVFQYCMFGCGECGCVLVVFFCLLNAHMCFSVNKCWLIVVTHVFEFGVAELLLNSMLITRF